MGQFRGSPNMYEEASDDVISFQRYTPTPKSRTRYLWSDDGKSSQSVAAVGEESTESEEYDEAEHVGENDIDAELEEPMKFLHNETRWEEFVQPNEDQYENEMKEVLSD